MVADTGSLVIDDIQIFLRSALNNIKEKKIKKPSKKLKKLTTKFSALNRLVLVFLSYLEVSGNRHKPKKNYMADDSHTENFQGLASF